MSGGPPGKDLNDSMDSPARPAAPSTSSSSSAPPSGPPEFEQLYDHERYSYSTLDDALQAGRTLAERCGFSLRIKSTARTVVTGVVHKVGRLFCRPLVSPSTRDDHCLPLIIPLISSIMIMIPL